MSHTLTVEEAAGRLAELISSLQPGEEITLTSKDLPVAKIVPQPGSPRHRRPGACKGMLILKTEDDEHLKDFKDYMY